MGFSSAARPARSPHTRAVASSWGACRRWGRTAARQWPGGTAMSGGWLAIDARRVPDRPRSRRVAPKSHRARPHAGADGEGRAASMSGGADTCTGTHATRRTICSRSGRRLAERNAPVRAAVRPAKRPERPQPTDDVEAPAATRKPGTLPAAPPDGQRTPGRVASTATHARGTGRRCVGSRDGAVVSVPDRPASHAGVLARIAHALMVAPSRPRTMATDRLRREVRWRE